MWPTICAVFVLRTVGAGGSAISLGTGCHGNDLWMLRAALCSPRTSRGRFIQDFFMSFFCSISSIGAGVLSSLFPHTHAPGLRAPTFGPRQAQRRVLEMRLRIGAHPSSAAAKLTLRFARNKLWDFKISLVFGLGSTCDDGQACRRTLVSGGIVVLERQPRASFTRSAG